jgi:hypothetical protein
LLHVDFATSLIRSSLFIASPPFYILYGLDPPKAEASASARHSTLINSEHQKSNIKMTLF